MRAAGLLMLVVLVAATPARAQTPPPPPDANVSQELLRRGDELARLRGRGATRVVIGSVLLGLGLVLGGVSAVLWENGGNSYSTDLDAFYQGAIAMDTIAFGMIGGGTALVAIGAGNITEGKRPRLLYGANGFAVHF